MMAALPKPKDVQEEREMISKVKFTAAKFAKDESGKEKSHDDARNVVSKM